MKIVKPLNVSDTESAYGLIVQLGLGLSRLWKNQDDVNADFPEDAMVMMEALRFLDHIEDTYTEKAPELDRGRLN